MAGLGNELHQLGLRKSFGGQWLGYGQGCLEPLPHSPQSTSVEGPGPPSEPGPAAVPTTSWQSGLFSQALLSV